MQRLFTVLIIVGMAAGLGVGAYAHDTLPAADAKDLAGYFALVTGVFLTLIKMIIAPLVFTTLAGGVAHMGDASAAGRVAVKTLGWFIIAGIISLSIGMVMVDLLQPGAGFQAATATTGAGQGANVAAAAAHLNLKDFLAHVFPTSIVDAMAKNEVLQIVVFSLFAGFAMGALGEKVSGLVELLHQGAQVMLKVTDYVMTLAPIAVFSSVAGVMTTYGLAVLSTYAKFVGGFYLSLGLFWVLLGVVGFIAIGRRFPALVLAIREPALIAFSTASSEAAYPRLLEKLEQFGVSNRIASFVLPLGYSFNLDGSMMYTTFASLFIAQAFNVPLSFEQKLLMMAMLMITSKGIAGVPRASLVVVQAVLPMFKIPEAGIALILGVDWCLDMGRTCTNVIGNSVAAAAVARSEGQLRAPEANAP
ncbi:MAG: dicarboxylate/amino acid:cation symporter [Pseudomonadota bacterium]|jgi:Na+/H+-dicarboxylate symporter